MSQNQSAHTVTRTVQYANGSSTTTSTVVSSSRTFSSSSSSTHTNKSNDHQQHITNTSEKKPNIFSRIGQAFKSSPGSAQKPLPTHEASTRHFNQVTAAPTPTTNQHTTTTSSSTEFVKQCVQAHNDYRARHAAEPLQVDATISKHAQLWADVSVL